MEIVSLEEFASIDKQMTERDVDAESWPLWREDPFKLDSESTLDISRSFWEDLTHSEDSQALFASTPPLLDARESSPSYFSIDESQAESATDNLLSPSHYAVENYAVENGGRFKRRRMLHFSESECLVTADSQPFETLSTMESTFVSCGNPTISGGSEFLMPVPSSPSNMWYPKDDENCKGADDKWMSKCLEHKEPHSPTEEVKPVVQNAHSSEVSGKSSQSWPSSEGEVLQGPLTPFSKGSTPGWRSSPLTRFRVKASTPVVYPFALVKPSGAQGDITLNDINKRILSPSPHPSHRQLSRDDDGSPTHSGSGLSGKSVVACTKIHTEGNGTITIMRTRG